MDGLRQFLQTIRENGLAKGNLLALFVVAVGGKIESNSQVLSSGTTWRKLAELLKEMRWDRKQVQELNLTLEELPPRDRTKFWLLAISRAGVDSRKAAEAAERFVPLLEPLGFKVTLPKSSPLRDG